MWYRVLALSMVAGLVLLFTGTGLVAEERAKKERNKGARAADVKEFHGKIVRVDAGKRLLVIAEHDKGGPPHKDGGKSAVRPGGGEEERQQGDNEEQERKDRAKGAAKAGPGAGQHHGHHAFHVGERAEIKLDGKEASLSQLKEGQHAVVWAHPRREGGPRPGDKGRPGAVRPGGGEEERQQGDNEEQERKDRAKGATGAGAQHHEPPHLVAVRIHAHSEGHRPGTTGGGATGGGTTPPRP